MKDPNDTRDIGPRVGSPLWIHLPDCDLGRARRLAAWPCSTCTAADPDGWSAAAVLAAGRPDRARRDLADHHPRRPTRTRRSPRSTVQLRRPASSGACRSALLLRAASHAGRRAWPSARRCSRSASTSAQFTLSLTAAGPGHAGAGLASAARRAPGIPEGPTCWRGRAGRRWPTSWSTSLLVDRGRRAARAQPLVKTLRGAWPSSPSSPGRCWGSPRWSRWR